MSGLGSCQGQGQSSPTRPNKWPRSSQKNRYGFGCTMLLRSIETRQKTDSDPRASCSALIQGLKKASHELYLSYSYVNVF